MCVFVQTYVCVVCVFRNFKVYTSMEFFLWNFLSFRGLCLVLHMDVRVQILIWFQTCLLFTKPHFQTSSALKSTSFSGISDHFRLVQTFSHRCSHPWLQEPYHREPPSIFDLYFYKSNCPEVDCPRTYMYLPYKLYTTICQLRTRRMYNSTMFPWEPEGTIAIDFVQQ